MMKDMRFPRKMYITSQSFHFTFHAKGFTEPLKLIEDLVTSPRESLDQGCRAFSEVFAERSAGIIAR